MLEHCWDIVKKTGYITGYGASVIISIYRNLTLTKDNRNISVNKSVDIDSTL